MRLKTADGRSLWLAYGMNVHPGGCAETTRAAIHSTVLPLRERLGVKGPFGLAVRWSASGVEQLLAEPKELASLRALLAEEGLCIFSGNAFVPGDFHGKPLKASVYEPAWSDPARTRYTLGFAKILASLARPGIRISLSTSPCGWRAWGGGDAAMDACAGELARCAAGLARLHEETGVHVDLAIEPEPRCYIETTQELLDFFSGPLERALAGSPHARAHLGVCYDVCHQAVVHEDIEAGLASLAEAGIGMGKLQASCALEAPDPRDPAARQALARFDEPVYLHQVGARDAAGDLLMAEDLGAVLADVEGRWREAAPWRVHFHVPVFRAEVVGSLRTTQPELAKALRWVARHDVTRHLEIETYTWDVLPEAEHEAGSGVDLTAALACEYEWVLGILGTEGVHLAP